MKRLMFLTFALALAVPAEAFAAAPPPQHTLALPTDQVWVLIAGAIVPAATYVLNHYAPWLSETIKAVVHVVAAAVAGGIVQAITAGNVGLNTTTLQYVVTAVIAALAAHKLFWLPSGASSKLGGGTNAP